MTQLVYHSGMKWIYLTAAIIFFLYQNTLKAQQPPPTFRLHISTEPLSLDPSQQKGSGTMFLTNAMQWPLFLSGLSKPFQPGVLSDCEWKKKKQLHCSLSKNIKWSNGQTIVAADVKRTFDYFMDPKTQVQRPDLIENIQSVAAPNPTTVLFNLNKEEPRFQERLTSPLLAPLFSVTIPRPEAGETFITSGPYQIKKWDVKKKVLLSPNPYFKGHPMRPFLEFYFIAEDTTALTLYQTGKLDFLRRLPTAYLKAYQGKPDLHLLPLTRFDYLGFGPALEKEPGLRRILSRSVNYEDWKTILSARGRPGCFGIALDLTHADPCFDFEPTQINSWRESLKKLQLPPLEINYSTLGGDDHKRSMEWLQSEWKKNLGITVAVKGLENSIFQKVVNEATPSIFRYGVALDHLSCANALKQFLQNPKSSMPFKKEPLLSISQQLNQRSTLESEEELCIKAMKILIEDSWIIPLGRIHMSVLAKPEWKGWNLTPLNILDLSQLHFEK